MLAKLQAGLSGVQFLAVRKVFLVSTTYQRIELPLGPTSLLFDGYHGFFLKG